MIKSIFARPVFINPQAYLVIPQLANLSMLEPIDFTSTNTYSFESLGKVESKIISAKDEYILHIDLYELNGSCVLGEFYIGPATIGSIDDFTITTNGYITTIEVGGGDSGNIVYPGLIAAWSAKGKTNDDEDRAILKDLTGNGHDITLNGFAFSKMSGYGGYNYTYDNWTNTVNAEINGNIAIINGYPSTRSVLEINLGRSTPKTILRLKVSIEIKNNPNKLPIRMYFTGAADYPSKNIDITESGIYELPQVTSNNYEGNGYYIGFQLNNNSLMEGDENYYCRIQLLPEYPDALVFDGVDDYGQSIDRIKALTKYTIILKRKIIKATNGGCVLYKGDLRYDDSTENFGVEFTDNKYWYYYSGLLGNNKITPYQEDIIYAKEKSYNGQQMNSNLDNVADNPIVISTVNKTGFINMVFYSAYLFDRSLDEQEIKEFIRKYIDPEYLLPSKIPTPDCYYDFSQGSNDDETRDTIKDLSGNGNDAVAHNFAWSGMSGYDGYNLPIEKYIINGTFNGPIRQYGYDFKYGESIGKLRFNVSNLSEGTYFSIRIVGLDYSYIINKNGYWELKDITNNTGNTKTWEIVATNYTYNNVTIEFLPEYEGALVFDGVDDYISLDAFDSGFKTMFMVCNPFISDIILYDQRKNGADFKFAIYNRDRSELAYKQRNDGETYINGVLNTTIKTDNLINKKHLITIKNNSISLSQKPIIGSNYNNTQYFANMAIYKFLGFKEELTEEQIQAIIKKYNLLYGVDEIEVS